jgi:hypothetical protein
MASKSAPQKTPFLRFSKPRPMVVWPPPETRGAGTRACRLDTRVETRFSHRKPDLSMENRLHRTVEDNRFRTCYDLQMFWGIADSRSLQIEDLPRRIPLLEYQFARFVATCPKDPALC